MPITKTLTGQKVNGDPFVSGGNINITTNTFPELIFNEIDGRIGDPLPGETITVNGVSGLTYEFLGFGDVRGDPLQYAAFIRVDNGDGTFTTIAVDMNADGDQTPNLQPGNTKLKVSNLTSDEPQPFPAPACFTPGTLIETARGLVPIETLSVGDLVRTRDSGLQPLRWIGSETTRARGSHAPVVFAPGALGNVVELVVSQQHRMLVTGWQAQLFAGADEVLVAAKHMVNGRDIVLRRGGPVEYIHILFDRHEIVRAGGVWSESYYPAAENGTPEVRAEVLRLFPELASRSGQTALVRRVAKRHEAVCLVA